MTDQGALRSVAARKVRRTSLLLGAALVLTTSVAEPLYRELNGPALAVRVLWCAILATIGLILPRASARLYGFLLPVAGISSCWLFGVTVWLNGGIASPDFQYMVLFPLAGMVLFQDEVLSCSAVVVGTISAVAALSWVGHAPVAVVADSLATDVMIGILALFGTFSFRRVRLAELTTQRARAEALSSRVWSTR